MKHLFIVIIACSLSGSINAQTKFTEKEYSRNPMWISMIRDTAVNYFEAEKAFKIYFEHHAKPAGEQEDIGSSPDRDKKLSKKKLRELNDENNMRIEVKKYERWHEKVRPYVQRDGSIMPPSKRLEIWKQNQHTN